MNTTEQKTPAFYPELILYRDDLILIANKPAGIPIHETKDPLRPDFTRLLQNSLSLDYLRTANRLDLNTTGIVVFGLDSEAKRFWKELNYFSLSEKPMLNSMVVDSDYLRFI